MDVLNTLFSHFYMDRQFILSDSVSENNASEIGPPSLVKPSISFSMNNLNNENLIRPSPFSSSLCFKGLAGLNHFFYLIYDVAIFLYK